MKDANLIQFKEHFEEFKFSEGYIARVKQYAIVPVFREIIRETLKNKTLTNDHLTGFIQMFKFNGSVKNFSKYLTQNIPDKIRSKELSDLMTQTNQKGYTNAGKAAINKLSIVQLNAIKLFLNKAFSISSVEDAVKLCKEIDAMNIPEVKKGVYSPWLYYINPQIFPIVNNSHDKFREWIGMSADYPSCIKDFGELKELVNEKDLGVLDMFAYYFDESYKLKVLKLNGRKFYKMSHGIFKKKVNRDNNLPAILEKNNLIAIGKDTGKNQATNFIHKAQIGDYVYVCYGGDDLYCIGRIISDAKPMEKEYEKLIEGGEEWLCRTIEPIYFPINTSIVNLKEDKQLHMPSGNSTFYEVPKDQLENLNDRLFIPNCNLEIIDNSEETEPETEQNPNSEPANNFSMNTILYGPPGTGKTYSTIDESLKILDPNFTSSIRKDKKKRFAEFQKKQRVYFTTFHQNMAYEDFIEGIKPLEPDPNVDFLQYEVQDGLFMKACVEATFNYLQANFGQGKEVKKLVDFNSFFDILYDRIENAGTEKIKTKKNKEIKASITSQGNFSIIHEGSEKPYTVSRDRLSKLYEKYPNPEEITNAQDAFRKVIGGCNSTAYWSILNEIAVIRDKNEKARVAETIIPTDISYEDKRKIVQQYWDQKDYTVVQNDKSDPYVFIIDEINRGNVAQIFGELITLIEEDKRMGKMETIYAELPYSKHSFSIPPNLYLIGTMNTADRSVEALDTALRRRFVFEHKIPDPGKLKVTDDGINLQTLLTTINNRLAILKDSDHTIGHAWLWNIKNIEALKIVFANKILPLLQEYFYNDYEKLGLVLGDAFFELPHKRVAGNEFAAFSGSNGLSGQYRNKFIYKLKDGDSLTAADFLTLTQVSTLNVE